ncbi:MAG: argininosuccinate lyase, partial [Gemmatimonadales bacterium]
GGAADGADDEDIHSLVERLLGEVAGPVAGKLHTGRSRNDQMATDLRLWTMGAIGRLDAALASLGRALLARASEGLDILMPAYTHTQRAQPVRFAHWALAHAWPLARDRGRLADARRRAAVLPLGAGAIAGSGFPVDRRALADRLGFAEVAPNSLDAVGDRDFTVEAVFAATLAAVHASRLAEDLILFSTAEFGFVALPEGFTTGSSLMPQKRNPDALELARGAAGQVLGRLVGMLTTLKGMPAGYQKDVQETNVALFEALDRATDVAGLPFRDAHALVGRLVRRAEELAVPLDAVPPAEVRALDARLAGPLADLGGALEAVERRTVEGGTARAAVLVQLERAAAAFGA